MIDREPVLDRRGATFSSARYCLYCYTPLEATNAVSQLCPRCGRRHTRLDQAIYWSREPWLRRIEHSIKAGVVLSMVALFLTLAFAVDMGPHPVNTFFVGPLVWLGGVLWWTAGLITRKPRYFSPRLLWIGSIFLLALGTPLLMFLLDLVARRGNFGPDYWKRYLVLASPALPLLVLASILRLSGERFEVFKRERIEGGGLDTR